jgi:hypothetical protein
LGAWAAGHGITGGAADIRGTTGVRFFSEASRGSGDKGMGLKKRHAFCAGNSILPRWGACGFFMPGLDRPIVLSRKAPYRARRKLIATGAFYVEQNPKDEVLRSVAPFKSHNRCFDYFTRTKVVYYASRSCANKARVKRLKRRKVNKLSSLGLFRELLTSGGRSSN